MIARKAWLIRVFIALAILGVSLQAEEVKVGLVNNEAGAFKGYTLLAPLFSTSTYLIDMEGRVVNTWESEYPPGQSTYLLENGHLLRAANPGPSSNRTFHGGGMGGRLEEYTFDGELVWEFEYSSDEHLQHHDIARLPNGNILLIAWERKSAKEALAAGRNPETLSADGLWPDTVIEVKPKGKSGGGIVWEWHAWDHLVQEHDRSKGNYGRVADHPGLININPFDWNEGLSSEEREKLESLGYLGGSNRRRQRHANPDFMHTNSIAYNAKLDQIILSSLGFNEIWIIDHSTTTEEAAGHQGGKRGKGGDLLYRWGNPQTYGAGTAADQKLFAQHDAHWIPGGGSGVDHILVFNNGRGRADGDYSSVDEIIPPVDEKGRYARAKGSAFGPDKPVWSYTAPEKPDFFSTFISGAQRLQNGNTLICAGEQGAIFEVTARGDMVWKYMNPVKGDPRKMMGMMGGPGPGPGPGPGGPPPGMGRHGRERGGRDRPGRPGRPGRGGPGGGMRGGPASSVFRAYRYGPDYPGLAGRGLEPGKAVEELLASKEGKEGAEDEK